MTDERHDGFETELILGNNSYILFGRHRWIKGSILNGEFHYRTHVASGEHRLVLCIRGPKTIGFPVDEFVNEYLTQLPREQFPTVLDYARDFRRCCTNKTPSVKVVSESINRTALCGSGSLLDHVEIYFLGYGSATIEPGVHRLIVAPQSADLTKIKVNDLRAMWCSESAKVDVLDDNNDAATLICGVSTAMGQSWRQAMVALAHLSVTTLRCGGPKGLAIKRANFAKLINAEFDKLDVEEMKLKAPFLEAVAALDSTGMKTLAHQLMQCATLKRRLLNHFGAETSATNLLLLSRTDGVVTGPAAANDNEQYFAEMFSGDAA